MQLALIFSLPVVFVIDEVELRASLITGDCKRCGDDA
jgi:hypothetical protein